MTNTNCLRGMRCPECKQEDRLKIVARVVCDVTDNGSDANASDLSGMMKAFAGVRIAIILRPLPTSELKI